VGFLECVLFPTLTRPTEVILLSISFRGYGEIISLPWGWGKREVKRLKPFGRAGVGKRTLVKNGEEGNEKEGSFAPFLKLPHD